MNKIALFLVLSFIYIESSMGQTSRFTLNDVIRIAQEQSPDAILSKHRFRASYWQFRSFKASYLPGLSFSGSRCAN
jgi:outer membrane protein TolC